MIDTGARAGPDACWLGLDTYRRLMVTDGDTCCCALSGGC